MAAVHVQFLRPVKRLAEVKVVSRVAACSGDAVWVEQKVMGSAFLRGTISTAGTDVDTFSLDVPQSGIVGLACSAQRSGSGLRGTNVELHDSAGTSFKSQASRRPRPSPGSPNTRPPTPPDLGTAVRVGDAGTYFRKITAPTQDTTVTGKYCRCGVFVTP